jgi:hypothetical protein
VSSFILPPCLLSTTPVSDLKLLQQKKKKESTKHPGVSFEQKIKYIKTAHDLSRFLSKEHEMRKKRSSGSLTSGLDKFQWHMLHKVLSKLIHKLNSKGVVKGSDKYNKIMRRARKEMLVRIQ